MNNQIQKVIIICFLIGKMYDLFLKNISYSDIVNKEIYLLPILKKRTKFIFIIKTFYDMWNEISDNQLVEFILPLENFK